MRLEAKELFHSNSIRTYIIKLNMEANAAMFTRPSNEIIQGVSPWQ